MPPEPENSMNEATEKGEERRGSKQCNREIFDVKLSDKMLEEGQKITAGKKKKKRKPKKTVKAVVNGIDFRSKGVSDQDRPSTLCISRNKHWKYISSYHGPWLQLPLELLESLLVLNLDPATVSSESRFPTLPPPMPHRNRHRERSFSSLCSNTPPESPQCVYSPIPMHMPPLFPPTPPGKATPPPIDPGVFRSVTSIRRLIDEAAELSVRASSGLTSAALGAMRNNNMNLTGTSWSSVQSLGLTSMTELGGNNGRNFQMSATRVHRLRLLAVQKLAEAYKIDEIASSVMIMQGGTVFDDIAEKVLKLDPQNADARYVHFFHERIPSRQRQLAESTPTTLLDALIIEDPQRLEFYRTRGIVHCFRDEYSLAVKDFTFALRESRAVRKARQTHDPSFRTQSERCPKGKRKKSKVNGQAPQNGTSAMVEGPDGEQLLIHPSVLPDAPNPLEPQLLFHRGAAYLAHAVFLIEEEMYKIEGVQRASMSEFGELRFSYIENGRYGGTEIGNPDGPLGHSDGPKAKAYRASFAEPRYRDQVCSLLRKGKRDHERFLAHFDTLDTVPDEELEYDMIRRIEDAYLILETFRPNSRHADPPPLPDVPLAFTTFHPLMVESHFSILICLLLLGEFQNLVNAFDRSANLVAGLEGYPVFLPPRSMAQAEFLEVLDRLAGGWRYGKFTGALVRTTPRFPEMGARRTSSPLLITAPAVEDAALTSSCAGPSTMKSVKRLPHPAVHGSPENNDVDNDRTDSLKENLDYLRILLAPVISRQKEKAEKAAREKAMGTDKKKPAPINLSLHGPRVDIVLAWLGGVHLPELESVATT